MSDQSLPVVEIFHSLQGEGFHAGRSALFIRLAGCSVGCTWCDTKNSWAAEDHRRRRIREIVDEAHQARDDGAGFIVVTGGEPLEHDLTSLCEELRQTCLPLHIETSGTANLSGRFDWVTLSPKRHKPPLSSMTALCNELKMIVHTEDDLVFAVEMAKKAKTRSELSPRNPILIVQPGWQSKIGKDLAMNFAMSNREWRLSLQSHKILGIQ